MLKFFITYINNNKLFNPHQKILLGVSGGIDSMVLCDLFLKSGFKFGIAHCNFQLRNKESDGDEALVANYAHQHNLPFHTIRFDTQNHANLNNLSIQMAARELRYNWFTELLTLHQYNKIAVAHHADDAIETFFVNTARGTGIGGLCGIPVKNQHIIRPLLFATRQQITDYATQNNIAYRNDSSNASDKYTRNRIRLNIIPEFEKINPAFKQTMLNNMLYLKEVHNFVAFEMDKLAQTICSQTADKLCLSIDRLKQLPHINLFLHHVLQPYGFKNELITQIAESFDATSGKQFHSHTHTVLKDRDFLIVSPRLLQCNSQEEYLIYDGAGEINLPITLKYQIFERDNSFQINKNKQVAQFDYNQLTFPLVLRKWQHGDSFVPLGMNGRKKLSNYFSDNKYSLFDKQNQWILTSGNNVIWIVGKHIDNQFAINNSTKAIWQVELIN